MKLKCEYCGARKPWRVVGRDVLAWVLRDNAYRSLAWGLHHVVGCAFMAGIAEGVANPRPIDPRALERMRKTYLTPCEGCEECAQDYEEDE